MFCTIITTTNDKTVVENLSKYILKNNLSPCVQVYSNVKSQFIWKNNISNEYEYKIEIKTIESYEKKIIDIIEKIHNYKVPEIVKLSLEIKNERYKKWFLSSINK